MESWCSASFTCASCNEAADSLDKILGAGLVIEYDLNLEHKPAPVRR